MPFTIMALVVLMLSSCGKSSSTADPATIPRLEAPTSSAPTTLATTTVPTTTEAPPSTAQTTADPRSQLAIVSLRASDLPGPADQIAPARDVVRTSDTCKAIASSPFLVAQISTSFGYVQGDTNKNVESEIAVYDSEAEATAVASTMSSASWARDCDEPQNASAFQRSYDETNQQTSCGLSMVSHSESAATPAGLPAASAVWNFDAITRCGSEDQDSRSTSLTFVTHRANVVVVLFVLVSGAPTAPGTTSPYAVDPSDVAAFAAMVDRVEVPRTT